MRCWPRAAPDRSTWGGRRDHAILIVALQTGLRASEIVNLRRCDIVLGTGAHVRCEGKGRKQRATPLRRETLKVLEVWLRERAGADGDPLFPTVRGTTLSRDALEHLVRKHILSASRSCASLIGKRVSPHVLRHSTAMELLHHGVDQSVIALWLGHESVETTQVYMHADLRLKEKALARMTAPTSHPGRYPPDDTLLAFLQSL
jgi:integrase/recombinase XerD